MTPRAWFTFKAAAGTPTAEIHIYGAIGQSYYDESAVSAKDFLNQLAALPKETKNILVRVNSPGGSVFDGIAIANALRAEQQKNGRSVEVVVEGIAASIASAIIMAGSKVAIADNALVMVHNPFTIAVGNAADMRRMADTLDTVRDAVIATYQWRSALSADALIALMDAETWMDADEAIANGFGTEKVEGLKAAASLDPRSLQALTVPDRFRAQVDALLAPAPAADLGDPAPTAATAIEILAACRAADCFDLAESLLADGAPLADVQSRVEAERVRRSEETAAAAARQAEATARETAIHALCKTAGIEALAVGYVRGGMSLEDIRAHLTTITAVVDKATIDTGLSPDQGVAQAGVTWKQAFTQVNAGTRR